MRLYTGGRAGRNLPCWLCAVCVVCVGQVPRPAGACPPVPLYSCPRFCALRRETGWTSTAAAASEAGPKKVHNFRVGERVFAIAPADEFDEGEEEVMTDEY